MVGKQRGLVVVWLVVMVGLGLGSVGAQDEHVPETPAVAASGAPEGIDHEPAIAPEAEISAVPVHGEPVAGDHAEPIAAGHEGTAATEGHAGPDLGSELPLWSVIPFVGILLSIAVFPLVAPHFWHAHFPKISALWAVIFAAPFLWAYGREALYEILHIYVIDYIPFIILLWALFTVAGGIRIKGSLAGTPGMNTLMLVIGTIIASWVGTTGAAMLMIRPVLRANARRAHKVHTIVFFIFLVANIGGSLTPLGDPPLFLGFLHGVPFFWTLGLIREMGFVAGILVVIYFVLDVIFWRRETEAGRQVDTSEGRFGIDGLHNLIFLGGILGGVILSGIWKAGEVSIFGVHQHVQNLARDGILIIMGLLSMWTTRRETREANGFSWFPILEVAYLFAGIFMTIIPALAILKAGEHGAMAGLVRAVREPWQFFWVTGGLSSFLDNAPTYLTFLTTAEGLLLPGVPEPEVVHRIIADFPAFLTAISTGAVFMGAMTYIGNAPNFMVKSIAEEAGVEMPSFFGYLLRWSLVVLVPVFILVTFLFYV